MTQQDAIDRIKQGDTVFVHTPEPPDESFYFFASDFTTASIPLGRRIRGLKGIVMLIKVTEDFPESPYFCWKMGIYVTEAEAQCSAWIFCKFDRFEDAQALKDRFPHYFPASSKEPQKRQNQTLQKVLPPTNVPHSPLY